MAEKEKPKSILEWEAPESVAPAVNAPWYALVVGVGIVLIALDFVLAKYLLVSPWLTSAVIVVGVVALIVHAKRPPAKNKIVLSDKFISINTQKFSFSEIKSFAIIDLKDHYVLRLFLNSKSVFPVSIIIGTVSPEQISEHLSQIIPAESHKPTILDAVAKLFRF